MGFNYASLKHDSSGSLNPYSPQSQEHLPQNHTKLWHAAPKTAKSQTLRTSEPENRNLHTLNLEIPFKALVEPALNPKEALKGRPKALKPPKNSQDEPLGISRKVQDPEAGEP